MQRHMENENPFMAEVAEFIESTGGSFLNQFLSLALQTSH